MWERCW